MYYGRSTNNQNIIPSFQTIDFRLSSRNLSQYPSLCDYNNAYQAGSLTYTESQIDQVNSMKFLQEPLTSLNNFPQSFMNVDIDLVNKPQKVWHQQQQSEISNPQKFEKSLKKKQSKQTFNIVITIKESAAQQNDQKMFGNNNNIDMNRKKSLQNNTVKMMNRKKSILMVNNLQLNFFDNNNSIKNHKNITEQNNNKIQQKKLFQNNINSKNDQMKSIITNPSIHVKSNISSGKLSILSRSRKSSVSSQSTAAHNLLSPPTTEESIGSSIVMGSPYSHKTEANDPSQINLSSLSKKRCFSEVRRPKSAHPISSSEGSSLCCILKKQNYQSLMKELQKKTTDRNNLSALSIDSHINESSNKTHTNSGRKMNKNTVSKTEQKIKQIRRRKFLEDAVPLNQIMNVKQMKLEQNLHVQKNYLRKIIQNRVTIHHFSEHENHKQN